MALSLFTDKAHRPTDSQVRAALGPTHALWQQTQQLVADAAPAVVPIWAYTSASTGWGCRLKLGKRILLYLAPRDHHFLVSIVLGEKAVARAREEGLPVPLLALLEAAPRYAEGRGIRFPVHQPRDLRYLRHLIDLKLGS